MASTATREYLSGAATGSQIKVVQTGSPGTTIHTSGGEDEITLMANNQHTADVDLTIQWGGTSADDAVVVTLAPKEGYEVIIPGAMLGGSKVIRAYAGTANVVFVNGYVNRISD